MATIRAAFRQFVAEPIVNRSPALFIWRACQWIHDRTGGRWDDLILRGAKALRPKASLPRSAFMDEDAIAHSVSALRKLGWNILPFRLPASGVEEITRFAFSTKAYAHSPTERISICLEQVPNAHPRYEWRISEILSLPTVQSLVADSALNRIAQEYIGCRPILTSVTLWLDTVYQGDFDAHVYHCDNDGPAFLKFFIYLTDVDESSGAHAFIQGSHSHIKPKRFQRSLRYDRNELLNHYGAENELVFAAPAGTILAEDTAGFHRGTTPATKPRLLMQLQYAAFDIPHIEEFALGINKVKITDVEPWVGKIAHKFIRR